jgi:hypothetical protein
MFQAFGKTVKFIRRIVGNEKIINYLVIPQFTGPGALQCMESIQIKITAS